MLLNLQLLGCINKLNISHFGLDLEKYHKCKISRSNWNLNISRLLWRGFSSPVWSSTVVYMVFWVFWYFCTKECTKLLLCPNQMFFLSLLRNCFDFTDEWWSAWLAVSTLWKVNMNRFLIQMPDKKSALNLLSTVVDIRNNNMMCVEIFWLCSLSAVEMIPYSSTYQTMDFMVP